MAFRVDHDGFSSREYGRKKYRKYTMRYFGERFSGRRSRDDGGASMLAKMGLCAILCALALGINRFGGGEAVLRAVSAVSAEAEELGEEYLGKLRFVELPGIIEVFSPSAKLRVGCSFKNAALLENDTLLSIDGACGYVAAPASGTVRSAGKAEGRGSLDIALEDDITVRYSGLAKVNLEEGQQIDAGDTLGTADGTLEILVWKEGRPQNPAEYFDAALVGA